MDPTQASYLLQKVAPLVMRELGPRVGPYFAEKVGVPLAKKVGLPIARRIGIPIARRTGMLLFNKFGYPLINKTLFKLNLDTPNSGALKTVPPVPQGTAVTEKPKKNLFGFKNLLTARKGKKNKALNKAGRDIPAPVVPTLPKQIPAPNPVIPNVVQEQTEQDLNNPYYSSTLFNKRRNNYGF
jgi:hypothetical protein